MKLIFPAQKSSTLIRFASLCLAALLTAACGGGASSPSAIPKPAQNATVPGPGCQSKERTLRHSANLA